MFAIFVVGVCVSATPLRQVERKDIIRLLGTSTNEDELEADTAVVLGTN